MILKRYPHDDPTVIQFRPKPKTDPSHYLKDDLNLWTILSVDDATCLFQNIVINHEISLAHDSIREFRKPDLVILRGQVVIGNDGSTTFEPFVPGIEPEYD